MSAPGGPSPSPVSPWRRLIFALLSMDFLFKVDFRFWVVALKLLSPRQFGWFLAYFLPFAMAFIIMSRALHAKLAVKGDGRAGQYWTGIGGAGGRLSGLPDRAICAAVH